MVPHPFSCFDPLYRGNIRIGDDGDSNGDGDDGADGGGGGESEVSWWWS